METATKINNYNGRLQQPLSSGYNATTMALEVIEGIDLEGMNAIVTGGSTGIGVETTRALAAAGATVIVPARDLSKARKNLKGVQRVEFKELDLIDPRSIDSFADKFLESGRPLHLLINNAGIMWVPLRRDNRGFESQLATNYLGHFHLTARLWPALKKAKGARVVNVSSHGHQFGAFDFDDPQFNRREYETLLAYGQSKTAMNLFTIELDERAKEFNVRAYSLHPGSIFGTELGREASPQLFQEMGFCDSDGNILPEVLATLKTVSQGAATTVWCATSPLLEDVGGVYCEDADVVSLRDGRVKPWSLDETSARRLWAATEAMLSMKFEVI